MDTYRNGLPTQTTVSAGGLFYGQMLPGNQWIDEATGERYDSFDLNQADEIEESLAQGKTGLLSGGTAYLSTMTGGAEKAYFTLSEMAEANEKGELTGRLLKDYAHLSRQLLTHPIRAVQSGVHFASTVVHDLLHKKETERSYKTIFQDAAKETFLSDGAAYATDTPGGRILKWTPGSDALELWAHDARFENGLDGIAFGPDGRLYVNNVSQGTLFAVALNDDGTAGAVTQIETSAPLAGPDGMRTAADGVWIA